MARKFIEQKTKDASPSDLILFAGDMNCNGQKENLKAKAYREEVEGKPGFDIVLEQLENEYGAMFDIISNKGEDEIVDCTRVAYGESPVTYGDTDKDPNGKITPLEIVLTDVEDYHTCQSLDYIFIIRRKGQQSSPAKTSESLSS